MKVPKAPPIMLFIQLIQLVGLIGIFSSIPVWCLVAWYLAWRLFLSGVGLIIAAILLETFIAWSIKQK